MSLPAQTLTNERHEKFAQLVALGVELGAAWVDSAPPGSWPNKRSANVTGSRNAKRPEVAARVKFLQGERSGRATAPLALSTPSDLRNVLRALTEALSGFYGRLKAEGATEDELQSVRALSSAHSQRALSLTDLAEERPCAASAAPLLRYPSVPRNRCAC